MAQRNSRASVGGEEDVLSFPSPLAPDKGATALDLVYQAADIFRGMEKHARETEARAQSLCTSALERLRLAEMRAEAAERAQRELIVTTERKLQGACRALEQAQSCMEAQKDKLTAVELRAEVAEDVLEGAAAEPAARLRAASIEGARASRSDSSVRVPGVTSLITSRLTGDLVPRRFASAGSSICSQKATLKPLRSSFER